MTTKDAQTLSMSAYDSPANQPVFVFPQLLRSFDRLRRSSSRSSAVTRSLVRYQKCHAVASALVNINYESTLFTRHGTPRWQLCIFADRIGSPGLYFADVPIVLT